MNPNWKTNYVRYRTLFLNLVGQYKKREDTKVYLELFLSLATVSIFAIFALRPTLLTISGLIKEIEAKQETIEQMDNKIEDIIAAQRAYDQNRQNIAMLNTAIPSKADPEVILRQLEGAVSDTQVSVSQLEMGEMLVLSSTSTETTENTEKMPGDDEITLSITTVSDYTNLLNFITTLEELRKPLNIKTTNFSYTSDDATSELTLTVEVGLPIVKQQ